MALGTEPTTQRSELRPGTDGKSVAVRRAQQAMVNGCNPPARVYRYREFFPTQSDIDVVPQSEVVEP